MPYFDGTGPLGRGPMGRGLGPCGGGRRSGIGYGFGYGAGSGFGRGFRGMCRVPGAWNQPRWGAGAVAPQDEVQALKQEASYLQNALEAIQKRLNELEGA